jgi:predicted histone-like DNA-binding protein
MAVPYSVFKQTFDVSRKGELRYNARAQSSGELTFKTLTRRISDRCTVTPGDVMAVLEGCITVIQDALEDGMIVRLGDFGSFQISISSSGTLTENAFTASNITGAKILFRPGEDLNETLANLTYTKVRANRSRATKGKG